MESLRIQDLLGWVPGSIKDENWAECGNLALKELPNEICFCLARMGHFKVKAVPWHSHSINISLEDGAILGTDGRAEP